MESTLGARTGPRTVLVGHSNSNSTRNRDVGGRVRKDGREPSPSPHHFDCHVSGLQFQGITLGLEATKPYGGSIERSFMTVSRDLGGVCRALQPAQKHRARLAVLGRFDPFLCRALLAFGSETACKRAREQEQRVADTSSQPPPPPASQNRMRLVAR